MGKIKQGILGGFNGTTGSVVGASWKGIAYMRGKAQSIKNPRTGAQQENRTIFGQLSDLGSRALNVVSAGFIEKAVKKSGFNAFVQENRKNGAFVVDNDESEITYNKIAFSAGSLHEGSFGTPTLSATMAEVTATIEETPCEAYLVVVEETTLNVASTSMLVVEGAGSTVQVDIPATMRTNNYHVFGFFVDTVSRKATNTVYLGSHTV